LGFGVGRTEKKKVQKQSEKCRGTAESAGKIKNRVVGDRGVGLAQMVIGKSIGRIHGKSRRNPVKRGHGLTHEPATEGVGGNEAKHHQGWT